MKTLLTFLCATLFLAGCATTRSLHCPFTAEQTSQAELLGNLTGEWELYSLDASRAPDKLIGQIQFAQPATGSDDGITAQISSDDNGRLAKHPPLILRGAQINGETFLALGSDLQALAKQAGYDDPGSLAAPLFLLLRLSRYDNSSLIAEGITFAQFQNGTWTPLDPAVAITTEGVVTATPEKQLDLLKQKKYTLQGAMFLQPKP